MVGTTAVLVWLGPTIEADLSTGRGRRCGTTRSYSCLWADSDTDTEFEVSLLIRVLANSVFSLLID